MVIGVSLMLGIREARNSSPECGKRPAKTKLTCQPDPASFCGDERMLTPEET